MFRAKILQIYKQGRLGVGWANLWERENLSPNPPVQTKRDGHVSKNNFERFNTRPWFDFLTGINEIRNFEEEKITKSWLNVNLILSF